MVDAYRAVFLSPHLDDAVFSCGGLLARLAKTGPVLVLNLFTEFPRPIKNRGIVLGSERYKEEVAAARLLGFESRRLGEPDAVYRDPAYESLGNLFRPPQTSDEAGFPALREKVDGALKGIVFNALYVPLGIGWHVDHVLTHRLIEKTSLGTRLIYYEDAPYCLLPHTTRYRFNDLGSASPLPGDESLAPASILRSWIETSRAYMDTALMRNLRPALLRLAARPVVTAYLLRLLASHARPPAGPGPGWESTVVGVRPEFEKKLDAMELYQSQFREFFLSREDCARQFRLYAERVTGRPDPVERYWSRAMAPGVGRQPEFPS
ncbi:MAG: PIG-L family deacetylase [Elusimicrobia bacterium]|nr:PIG-L family deacetylase [Elusimicrobiota bacterium]